MAETQKLAEVLKKSGEGIIRDWIEAQIAVNSRRVGEISKAELATQSQEFLDLLIRGLEHGGNDFHSAQEWKAARDYLTTLSRSRGLAGFSPTETANFILSIKPPFIEALKRETASDANAFAKNVLILTALLDSMALFTTEIHQKAREEVISRQQEDMLELSTPVVKLWDGILALPIIGTLDSSRTQIVMESLLQKIVEQNSDIAIIDITGVPTFDTLVAQHLIKTVTAARLMGAECIISGIRPQIAATIVHLGVDLGNIATKATLADAFKLGLSRLGRTVQRSTPKV